jgi:hypothetical protein
MVAITMRTKKTSLNSITHMQQQLPSLKRGLMLQLSAHQKFRFTDGKNFFFFWGGVKF